MKVTIGIVAVIILIIAGIVIFSPDSKPNDQQSNSNTANSTESKVADPKKDLVIGKAEAKAMIIEYGDFKCPSCNAFHHGAGQQLREGYINDGKLKVVFRAIAVIGPDSERSAIGAYCANEQSKFTEYHDSVYNFMWDNYYKSQNFSAEYKDILSAEKLRELALQAGLDGTKFAECLNKSDYKNEVEVNMELASNDGVRGTPTFKIGDQIVTGPQPYGVFKKLVDIQLQ
ncbi:DsbA family protein [Candidatus Saccharibacteria bacterium]|nr:DsbA family protein [Candidatus Saccharibacteria bacterium]